MPTSTELIQKVLMRYGYPNKDCGISFELIGKKVLIKTTRAPIRHIMQHELSTVTQPVEVRFVRSLK